MLQWHHMLTSADTDNIGVPYYPADTVHGLQVNTLWDGLFTPSPGWRYSSDWGCCTTA